MHVTEDLPFMTFARSTGSPSDRYKKYFFPLMWHELWRSCLLQADTAWRCSSSDPSTQPADMGVDSALSSLEMLWAFSLRKGGENSSSCPGKKITEVLQELKTDIWIKPFYLLSLHIFNNFLVNMPSLTLRSSISQLQESSWQHLSLTRIFLISFPLACHLLLLSAWITIS